MHDRSSQLRTASRQEPSQPKRSAIVASSDRACREWVGESVDQAHVRRGWWHFRDCLRAVRVRATQRVARLAGFSPQKTA